MPHPTNKRGRTSKRTRASHFALKGKNHVACPSCGSQIIPHKACPDCGAYKKRAVVDVKKRKTRLAKKTRKIS